MLLKLRRSFTYANVMATVAVFLALGGSAYALTVTGKQVRNSSLTGADIKRKSVPGSDLTSSSVTSGKIRNGNLTGTDVRDGSLTRSDLAANATGVLGREVVLGTANTGPADTKFATATCPSGKVAVGGGADIIGEDNDAFLRDSRPDVNSGNAAVWTVEAHEKDTATGGAWTLLPFAVCVTPAS